MAGRIHSGVASCAVCSKGGQRQHGATRFGFGGVFEEAEGIPRVLYLPRCPIYAVCVECRPEALRSELIAADVDEISRSGSSGCSGVNVKRKAAQRSPPLEVTHGVQLYIHSAAHLHPRPYIWPVIHPYPVCRCHQIPIFGHRTLIQSCRARPSRVATTSSSHSCRRE